MYHIFMALLRVRENYISYTKVLSNYKLCIHDSNATASLFQETIFMFMELEHVLNNLIHILITRNFEPNLVILHSLLVIFVPLISIS
jgi:hypothetical protein